MQSQFVKVTEEGWASPFEDIGDAKIEADADDFEGLVNTV